MKTLITGGCGKCGTALVDLPHEKVFFDRAAPPAALGDEHFVQGDLSDPAALTEAMRGCQALIHLAASPQPESSWEDVLEHNIRGMENALQAAETAGVERVIFASSNHAVGMYELDNAPRIYARGHGIVVNKHSPTRPDSYYGVSKVFGEELGRFYAEQRRAFRFYALRIGGVLGASEDHPYGYAEAGVADGHWERDSEPYRTQEARLKAMWLSRRDLVQLVDRCLGHQGAGFDVFYGVSDNANRWLDIEDARRTLGYRPEDSAEDWTRPPL
jgi:NAD+ dependent glucose-6-phosphate dehydrogenase